MVENHARKSANEMNHLALGLCAGLIVGLVIGSIGLGLVIGIAFGGMLDTWEMAHHD